VSSQFQEQAVRSFAGNSGWSGVTTLQNCGGAFEDETSLTFAGGMAGKAVAAQNGQDLPIKTDRL
jgi:hypothetical protein